MLLSHEKLSAPFKVVVIICGICNCTKILIFFCFVFLSAPAANNDTVDALRDELAQLRLALAREKVLPLNKN